jgi:hypothetical protein
MLRAEMTQHAPECRGRRAGSDTGPRDPSRLSLPVHQNHCLNRWLWKAAMSRALPVRLRARKHPGRLYREPGQVAETSMRDQGVLRIPAV